MRQFHVATDEEIKGGKTTDIYFVRTKHILEAEKLTDLRVFAEVTVNSLPRNWPWGVLCGVEEVSNLLEGCPVNVASIPEGTVFRSHDSRGVRIPILTIDGRYADFSVFETPLLGLLCQASGIATVAARVRKAAGEKQLISFGVRRMHPALAPVIDRAAYIGGVDGVSSLVGAQAISQEPTGTMPHALIIAVGDQVKAWQAFDKHMPAQVPRVALIDTFCDEKTEAIMAAETLGDRLDAVRLDTPSSRKGSFSQIIREVRWELDLRGFKHVKIIVSGSIDEESIVELNEAGADGYGVGTSISNAPTIDFALDIVERNGKPLAKRGKLGGRKRLWRCTVCFADLVTPATESDPKCLSCGKKTEELLRPIISDGKKKESQESVEKIRSRTLAQLRALSATK